MKQYCSCFTILVVLLTIFAFVDEVGAAECILVEEGKPRAEIIVADSEKGMLRYAARELSLYVQKISGAELPVRVWPEGRPLPNVGKTYILIGNDSRVRAEGVNVDDLPFDGFRVKVTPNRVVFAGRTAWMPWLEKPAENRGKDWLANPGVPIAGCGEAGPLFAVYKTLEKHCGVKWFWPGELGEVVPKSDRVALPVGEWENAPDFEMRYLSLFGQSVDAEGARWYRRLGFGGTFDIMHPNHTAHVMFCGKARERWMRERPDFFKGKPSLQDRLIYLNWAAPGMVDAWMEFARDFFAQYPNNEMFAVVPADGAGRGMDGQEFSNGVWGVVNGVAKSVGREFPGKYVGGLAYARASRPPSNIDNLEPNVLVTYCAHPLMMQGEEYRQETSQREMEWLTKKPGLFSTWDYAQFHRENFKMIPVFAPRLYVDRWKRVKDFSRGSFIESFRKMEPAFPVLKPLHDQGKDHMFWYIISRALWDIDVDVDVLLDEGCEAFYGPAAEPMRRFWDIQEQAFVSRTDPMYYSWLFHRWQHVYTPDVLRQMFSALDEAQKRAAQSERPEYGQRLKVIAREYAMLRASLIDNYEGLPKDNRQPNGSFEKGNQGEWFLSKTGATLTTEKALSGKRCLRIDPSHGGYAMTGVFDCTDADFYVLSCWYKAKGEGNPDHGQNQVTLSLYKTDGPEAEPAPEEAEIPGEVKGAKKGTRVFARPYPCEEWQRLFMILPVGKKWGQTIQLRLEGTRDFTVWFDDLSVTPMSREEYARGVGLDMSRREVAPGWTDK